MVMERHSPSCCMKRIRGDDEAGRAAAEGQDIGVLGTRASLLSSFEVFLAIAEYYDCTSLDEQVKLRGREGADGRGCLSMADVESIPQATSPTERP